MNYLLANFRRYGSELNSHDLMKFVAISLMVVDHVGFYFFPHFLYLRLIGRLSFPLFFFLIGYSNKFDIKKDLIVMAVLLAVNNFLVGWPEYTLNILFTVIFCRIFLAWVEKKGYLKNHLLDVVVVLVFLSLPTQILFEYGAIAPLFATIGLFVKKRGQYPQALYLCITTIVVYCLIEIIGFHFNDVQSVLLVVGVSLETYILTNYSLRNFTGVPKLISYPVMFIGRNSLVIYFLHVAAFKWVWHFRGAKLLGF